MARGKRPGLDGAGGIRRLAAAALSANLRLAGMTLAGKLADARDYARLLQWGGAEPQLAFALLRAGLLDQDNGVLGLPTVELDELGLTPASLPELVLQAPMTTQWGVGVDQLAILAGLVKVRKPLLLVEIGVATGRTTLNLAASSPADARIIAVDLRPDEFAQLAAGFEQGCLLTDHSLAGKIELRLTGSRDAGWEELAGQVDFMFIDGDHTYQGARADSLVALRVCRRGGMIVWHDYSYNQIGVKRCLDELARNYPIRRIARGRGLAVLEVGA